MSSKRLWISAIAALAGACHGHGEQGPPSSLPINPVTVDAVFVINGGDATISVLDATTDTLIDTIVLEEVVFPHHLYVSGDGTRLALGILGEDTSGGHHTKPVRAGDHTDEGGVMVLDAATGSTLVASRFYHPNHNAIFSPDGTEIWTTQLDVTGQLLILEPSTLATVDTVVVGQSPLEVTFSADGARAFVVNGADDSVTVIDVDTKQIDDTISVGDGPVGAWPGLDNVMYVDSELAKSVTAIDAATLAVVRTIDLGFTPGYCATPPGGTAVWITDADAGRVVVYATADGTMTGAVTTGAGAHAIAFSPDGTKAWVTNQTAGTVSVIDVAAQTVTATVTVGGGPNGALFRAAP